MEASWTFALIGGGLIGLAATVHLLVSGRISGISGIYSGMFTTKGAEFLWRALFVLGLVLGGILATFFLEDPFVNDAKRSPFLIIVAGFLVGFGAKMGSGCTSGHGVCGVSRMSMRSLLATASFMLAGMLMAGLYGLLNPGVTP